MQADDSQDSKVAKNSQNKKELFENNTGRNSNGVIPPIFKVFG